MFENQDENFLKSVIKRIRINNRKTIFISSLLVLGIFLVSIPANAEMNKCREQLFSDIIVLQVGTDDNTHLAVQTFLNVYPRSDSINVIKINSEKDLYFWLITPSHASHIIFGHGSKEGLILGEMRIAWDNLKLFINTNQKNFIPVMACYSGSIDGYYGGVPYAIDAEAAGIFGAYYIDMERNTRSILDPTLLSTAYLKQTLNKHPLSIRLQKWLSSPAAASMEVTNFKTSLMINKKWTFNDIVDPDDYYYPEDKNPYYVIIITLKEPLTSNEVPGIVFNI